MLEGLADRDRVAESVNGCYFSTGDTIREGITALSITFFQHKAFLISCANASQYGNNAYITPQATVDDGLLDVTILEPFTALDVPQLAYQLFHKTIDQNSRIKTFRCQHLKIHRRRPGVAHYDGDPVMMGEDLEVGIVKHGLRVLTPRDAEEDSPNVLQRAQDYINGLQQLNRAYFQRLAEDLKSKEEQWLAKMEEKRGGE